MNPTSILALIGLASSLIEWAQKERQILKENKEWSDQDELEWQKQLADAKFDPDLTPES